MSIFPNYGLTKTNDMFKSQMFASIGTELHRTEKIDYTHYTKMD
jgi:hypothetical protein